MQKIVINTDYGGFGLSEKATELLFKLKKWKFIKHNTSSDFTLYYKDCIGEDNLFEERDLKRDDPELIEVVKTLKKKANGQYANLKIVSVPDDVKWFIQEHDGCEWVAEEHRVWE